MISTSYALAFPAVAVATAGITIQAGTLTSGSPSITGLASTALLTAGMPVYGNNIPDGSLILSVVSGTAITITQNAVANGSVLITFPASALLTQLIQAAQQAIETYIGFPVETQQCIEYYSGNYYPDLILRRPYVTAVAVVCMDNTAESVGGAWGQAGQVTLTGTTTASSVSVTGISSTAGLQVGYSVIGTGIPAGTWIATIPNGTSVTLTQAATASATVSIKFAAAFNQQTLLTLGQDYALNLEGSYNGMAGAGLLRYLAVTAAGYGWWGGAGTGMGYGRSTLTPVGNRNPGWPMGQGNIQVAYTAGWDPNTNMPADLKQACVQLTQFMALVTPQGGQTVTNESLGKYSYGLGSVNMATAAGNALAAAGELGTTRQLLTRYRDWSV